MRNYADMCFWTIRADRYQAELDQRQDGKGPRDEADIQRDLDRCRERAVALENYRPQEKKRPYWLNDAA